MDTRTLPGGTVHQLPYDIQHAFLEEKSVLSTWHDITPLARNEYICWVTSAKLKKTQQKRLQAAINKLSRGERRPCCWSGCPHRDSHRPGTF